MKIAILSDIHGNHYALKEVLDYLEKNGISNIVILGDFIGYYYHPEKVLKMLRRCNYIAIKGNHEHFLENILSNSEMISVYTHKYGSSYQSLFETLSKEEVQYLLSLPESFNVIYREKKIGFFHGTPWSSDDYIYPKNSDEKIERCLGYNLNYIFLGHSHYQFKIKKNDCYIINPGSVGQSRSTGGYAEFAIMDIDNFKTELIAISYDIKDLEDEIQKFDPENKYLHNILHRRCNQ